MALINGKYEYIFFHIFKCAGNSMRKALKPTGGNELHGVHCEARDVKIHFETKGLSNRYNKYFKFTFVRNPYDWMASTYFYIRSSRNHFLHKKVSAMTFYAFLDYYINVKMKEERPYGSNKFITLNDFIRDSKGDVIVDFVGKVENIKEDFRKVCKEINYDFDINKLPYINVNGHRKKDYRQYYHGLAKKIVTETFKEDLDYFKYNF